MVIHLLPPNQQIAYLQIFITKYCCPVKVTFIRPPPFGVLPRSARLPYLFSPKGPA